MSSIEVHTYNESYRQEWEDFVAKSNNGTMFHKQAFLDYHPAGKFDFHHLMFRKDGKLIGVMPGGFKENRTQLWSPMGASYGGIATEDLPFEESLELIDALMDYCKNANIKELFIIPAPIIYNVNYTQHLEYAMLYRKFDFELHYISHAIDLSNKSDMIASFDKTARKTIRKVLKDKKITIRESDTIEDYTAFHHILVENKKRHNVTPTHSLDDMLKLRELVPNDLKLFIVEYEGKPIAGSWLFLCNKKVTLCFYNMLLFEYEHLKPIYLVNYEVERWSIENGYAWEDIGVSQDTSAEDPMTPSINLINFKERFSARGILRSTYHFKF